MSRVYVGRLPNRATEKDIQHFFRGYGKLVDIILKNGFGFVEFDDPRDADDAIYDLNGKELCGEKIILEFPRRKVGYNEDRGRGGGGGGSYGRRYGRPCSTRFRLIIENLSTRYTWQEIKDHIRRMGIEPTYSEAHKKKLNEALICFSSHDDLRRAMDKLDGEELNGRKLKCFDDTQRSMSRSRSRSRDRKRSRSSSRSRSRSRSPPPRRRSASRSRSRSGSPKRKGDKRPRSRSVSRDRSRSRDRKSRTPSPRGSPPGRSPSPKKKRADSGSSTPDR
ncbi:unnamed protein product [Caenorhabditis bovis]|uniref:RRM domain-containing protein n=1 Tax=Caenorhabditis bovis TaxID=2654633 RepID=A0A8S1ERA2_9PELO|nr:unnamed protein product [Caenorhabditis bovis]